MKRSKAANVRRHYLTVLHSLAEDVRPGSQQSHTQSVQHHPLAPVDHTIRQVRGVQGVDGGAKTLSDALRGERRALS